MRNIHPLRLLVGIFTLITLTALSVVAMLLTLRVINDRVPTLSSYATIVNPPEKIQDFTLTGDDNSPVTLDNLRGRYTLISFGYTHCPDVCPLTLTDFRRVKRELTEEEAEQINFVLISVDGERDTPEVLNRYIARFDPDFIGLTTTDDDIRNAVTADFNVYFAKREIEGTQATYLVDHTASVFLLNPQGEMIVLYPFGTPPTDIASDLKALL